MSRWTVALLLAMITIALAHPTRAAPAHVRLSLSGKDPSTTISITWNTKSGPVETTVEYGTQKGLLTQKAQGKSTLLSATLGSVSEAQLSGLTPGTLYYYRVGGTQGGFSAESSFHTGAPLHPSCGKLGFVVLGDSRAESWEGDKGASTMWPVIIGKAASHNLALVLHSGDIVYDGGSNEKQWDNHLAVTEPVSSKLPVLYVLGNHDDGPGEGDGAWFNKLFDLPRADAALGGSGTEDHYFVRYGPAIFVGLSTETFTGGSIKFKNQADWLDQILTQNPVRWKFVVLHRPIYTEPPPLIGHPPDEVGQNAALVPVMNKHHVDIVFQGHNHFYERFVPSACTNPASKSVCPAGGFDKGTVYITSGGAGAFPIVLPGGTSATRVAASGAHHYVYLEIQHGTLAAKALDDKGATIDSFTIVKPLSPDPCGAPQPADGGTRDAGRGDGRDRAAVGPETRANDTASGGSDRGSAGPGDGPTSSGGGGCSCTVADQTGGRGFLLFLIMVGIVLVRRRGS